MLNKQKIDPNQAIDPKQSKETTMAEVTLTPGSVVHVNGIPLKLVSTATFATNENNLPLLRVLESRLSEVRR